MEQQKIVFKTHYNYRELIKLNPPKKAPCFALPSMTVPDLSMTIDELLVRYERGLPLPRMKTPIYDDENLAPAGRGPEMMDMIDIHYYKKNSLERLQVISENVKKVQAKHADEMAKRKLNYEKFQEHMKKLDEQKTEKKGDSSTNTP